MMGRLPKNDSSFELLISMLSEGQQGVGIFDPSDRLSYANAYYRRMFALEDDTWPTWQELMRTNYARNVGSLITTDDFERWLASAASRRGKVPFRTFEGDLHDGRWVHVSETTLQSGWMLCIISDISDLGTDHRNLRQQRDHAVKDALTDPLTGLSNRRHLFDTLKLLHGQQRLHSVALVIADLDRFKSVNDAYGHHVGDVLLKHFGQLVQAQVRRDDLAGRMGGEEFLLVLRGVDQAATAVVMDRLFNDVRRSTPLLEHPELRYTCSAGVAFIQPDESVESALKRADTALYDAKAAGRDQWLLSPDSA